MKAAYIIISALLLPASHAPAYTIDDLIGEWEGTPGHSIHEWISNSGKPTEHPYLYGHDSRPAPRITIGQGDNEIILHDFIRNIAGSLTEASLCTMTGTVDTANGKIIFARQPYGGNEPHYGYYPYSIFAWDGNSSDTSESALADIEALISADGDSLTINLGHWGIGYRIYLDQWYNQVDIFNTGDAVISKKLSPSGMETTIADDAVLPATEYYTLQGIKIQHPRPGGIYIIRQGSNVQKCIMTGMR